MLIATLDVCLEHFQRAIFYRNIQGDKYREFEKELCYNATYAIYISNPERFFFVLRLLLQTKYGRAVGRYIDHGMYDFSIYKRFTKTSA